MVFQKHAYLFLMINFQLPNIKKLAQYLQSLKYSLE